jgi:HNH endonuclease
VVGLEQQAIEFRVALAASEPGVSTPARCAEIVEELARTEKACAVARARFAARAAEASEHRRRGFADASDWLAAASGSSQREARDALGTIAQARPELLDALLAGDVSLEQGAEIVAAPTEHEAALIELARGSALAPVRDTARKHRLEAMNVEQLHAQRQTAREVVHWKDKALGMICGRFALPPEVGVPFINRLDREADRVWRDAKRTGSPLTREQCAADALVALCRGGAKHGSGRAEVVYVVDLDAQLRGHASAGERCHIIGGGPVPLSVVQQQLRDAFVKVALHDGTKVDTIVHYGRRRPALLQSVLDLGAPPEFDGVGCAVDGCDRRYHHQWDHTDPFANGGPTSEDNLQPLCWAHHQEKTERDRKAGRLGPKRKERGP